MRHPRIAGSAPGDACGCQLADGQPGAELAKAAESPTVDGAILRHAAGMARTGRNFTKAQSTAHGHWLAARAGIPAGAQLPVAVTAPAKRLTRRDKAAGMHAAGG